ncbi:hypothetical protein K2X30_03205 [bacterium]|nr:hypothetical protein [bacterium]
MNSDAFLLAIRQLEETLSNKDKEVQQLKQDYEQSQKVYDRLVQEKDQKLKEYETILTRMKMALNEYRTFEGQAKTEINTLRKELTQYRGAWTDVLQKEKEAKLAIKEYEIDREKISALELKLKKAVSDLSVEKTAREQVERHAKSYQLELQNTLVRLHSAEAKFAELMKEQQALSASKRVFDQELKKAEVSMRERLEWEFSREKEKTKAEYEKKLAQLESAQAESANVVEAYSRELKAAHESHATQVAELKKATQEATLLASLDNAKEPLEIVPLSDLKTLWGEPPPAVTNQILID